MNSHEPRIVGGYSLHAAYDASKCPRENEALAQQGEKCGHFRCVDCCKQEEERDVEECDRCGRQISVTCSFDDEYS